MNTEKGDNMSEFQKYLDNVSELRNENQELRNIISLLKDELANTLEEKILFKQKYERLKAEYDEFLKIGE